MGILFSWHTEVKTIEGWVRVKEEGWLSAEGRELRKLLGGASYSRVWL